MELLAMFNKMGIGYDFFRLSSCDVDVIEYAKTLDNKRCDVCGRKIYRNKIFLVRENDDILQVGASCLKNFDKNILEVLEGAESQEDVFFNEFMVRFGMSSFNGKITLSILLALYKKRGFIKFSSYDDFIREIKKYNYSDNNIYKEFDNLAEVDEIVKYLKVKFENTRNDFIYKVYQYLVNIDGLESRCFTVLQYAIKLYFENIEKEKQNKISQLDYNQLLYRECDSFIVKDMFLKNNSILSFGYNGRYEAESFSYILIADDLKVLEISASNEIDCTKFIGERCKANNKYRSKYLGKDVDENIKSYMSQKYGLVTSVNRLKIVK